MQLAKLSLVNFKNYEQAEFLFSPRINCFTGQNGVGKTNVLDAVHYLSLCKSYFNPVDSQNIKFDTDFFVIQGEYKIDGEKENIYCAIKRNTKKQFKRNKKEYQKLSEHIGIIPLVMVSPADIKLIIDGSEERRKFIDSVIAQYDHAYLNDLVKYNKALVQRNSMLKMFNEKNYFDQASIDIWNEQLITLGTTIFEKRKEFINKLAPKFQAFYNSISKNKENVSINYKSDLAQNSFQELLINNLQKDRILQYTSKGPHKDDLLTELNGHPIKKTGSQGQQKTFLVSLKLAQYEFMLETTLKKPILLLDDIFDKFDQERVSQIVTIVTDDKFGQIFISDTNKNRLTEILNGSETEFKIFKIDNSAQKVTEL